MVVGPEINDETRERIQAKLIATSLRTLATPIGFIMICVSIFYI